MDFLNCMLLRVYLGKQLGRPVWFKIKYLSILFGLIKLGNGLMCTAFLGIFFFLNNLCFCYFKGSRRGGGGLINQISGLTLNLII